MALIKINDQNIVPLIIPCLFHKTSRIRETIARVLSKKKDIKAIEPLLSAYEKEKPNTIASNTIYSALLNISGKNFENNPKVWRDWWEVNKNQYIK